MDYLLLSKLSENMKLDWCRYAKPMPEALEDELH
jgi:hypothetical protein